MSFSWAAVPVSVRLDAGALTSPPEAVTRARPCPLARLTEPGTLTVSDRDHGEATFQAVDAEDLEGTYGSFTFDEKTGAWSYTVDDSKLDNLENIVETIKENFTMSWENLMDRLQLLGWVLLLVGYLYLYLLDAGWIQFP